MANKDYKAFIVEGEVREPQVIDNISKRYHRVRYMSWKYRRLRDSGYLR